MKKLATGCCAIAICLLPMQTVVASDATVTLERITDSTGNAWYPGGTAYLDGFPYDLFLEGRVMRDSGKMHEFELSAFVNYESIYGPERITGTGNAAEYAYQIPWTVPEPGSYFISIVASHIVTGSPELCKVAPALAASYVRDNSEEFTPGVIAKVGTETGIHGELPAQQKCEVEYYVQTIEVLQN